MYVHIHLSIHIIMYCNIYGKYICVCAHTLSGCELMYTHVDVAEVTV